MPDQPKPLDLNQRVATGQQAQERQWLWAETAEYSASAETAGQVSEPGEALEIERRQLADRLAGWVEEAVTETLADHIEEITAAAVARVRLRYKHYLEDLEDD